MDSIVTEQDACVNHRINSKILTVSQNQLDPVGDPSSEIEGGRVHQFGRAVHSHGKGGRDSVGVVNGVGYVIISICYLVDCADTDWCIGARQQRYIRVGAR